MDNSCVAAIWSSPANKDWQGQHNTDLPAKCYHGVSKRDSYDSERVVIVNPTKSEYEQSRVKEIASNKEHGDQAQQEQQQSQTESDRGNIIRSTDKKDLSSSVNSGLEPSANLVQYNRILVPHDGSEMSDRALNHAIYLSKMCSAEIVILHVVEHMRNMNSSAVTATSRQRATGIAKDGAQEEGEFDITIEGEVKHMIEEKMAFCKQAGVKSQVFYKIQTGKPVEEIVKSTEDMNVDLVVMASAKNSSLTKRILGSTSRKVLDSIKKPALIIHA